MLKLALITNSAVGGPHYGSVTKATANLINALLQHPHPIEITVISQETIPLDAPITKIALGKHFLSLRGIKKTCDLINKQGFDIVHCVSEAFVPNALFFLRAKSVLTLHGAEFFSHPKLRARARYRLREVWCRAMIRLFSRRVNRFLTVSSYALEPWSRGFRIPYEKLDYIYHIVSDQYSPNNSLEARTILNKYNLKSPYILHVGNFKAQKNSIRLTQAFIDIMNSNHLNEHTLVFVGPKGDLYQTVVDMTRNCSNRVQILGKVEETDLPILYACADFSAFPSLVESFGIPVIESMASGTPVITSINSALPEVCAGAALLVNPFRVKDISQAIVKMASDPELRESYKRQGLERAKRFRWSRIADDYINYYTSLLEQ